MSSQFDEVIQAEEADDGIDIMQQRAAFVEMEPEGKQPVRNILGDWQGEDPEAVAKAERERVFATAANASINFPDTASFFTFLEDSRAYLATGTLPGGGGSTETGAGGEEAPTQGDGA